MAKKVSTLTAAGTLTGNELVMVSQLSTTVTITATTISAQASDNSYNDSGSGFVTAGFAVDDQVRVTGFTGNVANNIVSGKITLLNASKMVIGGTDGDVIVDDAAGESVTITKWDSARTTIDDILAGAGVPADAMSFEGVIDCSANPNYPAADAGHVYKISVAGKIGGGSGPNVEVGDTIYCITDGSAAGTHAAVGANWVIVQANLDGAVIGPASSTDLRIAVFSGTTGKLLADGGKTIAQLREPAVQAVTSAATVTPTFSDDLVKITAQAAALALANPTGTAIPGHGLVIRIKDNGTARAISYDTQYRAIGVTLPTTTVISKTLYLGCIWNADDTKLDVVAVAQEA